MSIITWCIASSSRSVTILSDFYRVNMRYECSKKLLGKYFALLGNSLNGYSGTFILRFLTKIRLKFVKTTNQVNISHCCSIITDQQRCRTVYGEAGWVAESFEIGKESSVKIKMVKKKKNWIKILVVSIRKPNIFTLFTAITHLPIFNWGVVILNMFKISYIWPDGNITRDPGLDINAGHWTTSGGIFLNPLLDGCREYRERFQFGQLGWYNQEVEKINFCI